MSDEAQKPRPSGRGAVTDVCAVCRLLPEQGKDAWELNGIYTTQEAALAACTDDQTSAARFALDTDYSAEKVFDCICRAQPEPQPWSAD